jgi:spore maturation protein CgeB
MSTVKRLLILGTEIPERMEAFYANAFRRLGVEVTIFDPDLALRWSQSGRIRYRLTYPFQHLLVHRALTQFYARPRWDAVLVFKGHMVSAKTIAALRRRADVPWTVLAPDSPWERGISTSSHHMRDCIRIFDLYYIWSRSLVERLRREGCPRPTYHACAYDESLHFPATVLDPSLSRTITLVGTYDRRRAAVMAAIADLPVRIYGNGWDRISPRSPLRDKVRPVALGNDLRRVVTSSLACLNILRPQNTGAHNMRTFEVPAMGGVLLASRSEEQNEFFPEGKASLMFASSDELREVIARLLTGQIDTQSMRQEALQRSRGHSYVERARAMLADIAAL